MEVFHVVLSFTESRTLTAWRKKVFQNLAVLLRMPDGRTVRRLWEGSVMMAEAPHEQRLWKTSWMGVLLVRTFSIWTERQSHSGTLVTADGWLSNG